MSCALVSVGDAAGFDEVGCSLGFGTGTARAGVGEAFSTAEALAGAGLGVLSASGSTFFVLLDGFFFPDFLLAAAFFFLVLEVDEELFDFLAEGVGRFFPPSSSASLDFELAVLPGDFFGFGVGDSSSSGSAFEGVFFGFGVRVFFFLGDGFGVTEGDPRCFGVELSLGAPSSLTWPCNNDAISAMIARAVAMQRR